MAGWEDLIGPALGLAGTYFGSQQAPAAAPSGGGTPPIMPGRKPDLGGPGGMVNQSVPIPGQQQPGQQSGADAQTQAMIDFYLNQDNQEAERQKMMVEMLRGGSATPGMRNGYAPKPIEYAATLANRLAGQQGQSNARDAKTKALEDFYRKQYGGGTTLPSGSAGLPADPGFAGVGDRPY